MTFFDSQWVEVMATRTRAARKRTKGSEDEGASASKKVKTVQWEWLGDGGKWTPYSEEHNETLIDSFCVGADEMTMAVAKGVKMKIRFRTMSQVNVTTGWPRDIRCVPIGTTNYKPSVWEWNEGGVWKRYPESTRRHLEAAYLSDVDSLGVTLATKRYNIDLKGEEMEDESNSSSKWKIRRVDPDDVNYNEYEWVWQDDYGNWKNYSDADSQSLESSFAAGTVNVAMTINGRPYMLDLMKMEQTNTVTKVSRKIKRRLQGSSDSTPSTSGSAVDVVKISMSVDSSGRVKKVVRRTPRTEASSVPGSSNGQSNIVTSATSTVSSATTTTATTTTSNSASNDNNDMELSSTATSSEDLKSHVFSGKAPVDSECTQKLGKAHVYTEGSEVWNSMLNQTNLKNNNNKFYLLQLLVDDNKPLYSVWFRWGRVGKVGQHQLLSFGGDLESAKDTFRKKFYDKTQNDWNDKDSFVKVPGKYDLLEMDYEAKEEKEETDAPEDIKGESIKPKPQSKLDKRVQELIQLICNVQAMEDVVKEMKYDTKKAPLGKLTTAQIKSGYAALKKIESLIQANNTRGDPIYKACDEFYTRIPHDFGMRRPPLITTDEEIKQKLALLEALSDIQIAMTVLQRTDYEIEHPYDHHYKGLHCDLKPLDEDNEIIDLIKKYVTQTHGRTHRNFSLDVQQVYEINREGEETAFKDVGNRQLLWHGSRLTNWVGILSQGLRIAPPEAPVTGYMFGKGIYFADMCSKSANYCFATPIRNEGLLLLSEVSLGKPNELLAADYNAHRLPKDTHSVKGLGRIAPDSAHNHTLPDGCVIPLGQAINTEVENKGGYTLNYNEFIVYDTSQVKMRYLLRVKFNFK